MKKAFELSKLLWLNKTPFAGIQVKQSLIQKKPDVDKSSSQLIYKMDSSNKTTLHFGVTRLRPGEMKLRPDEIKLRLNEIKLRPDEMKLHLHETEASS